MLEYTTENSPAPTTMKRLGMLSEWKGIFQLSRLGTQYRSLVQTKPGQGQRVILLPGFMSWETSMAPIKHFLQRTGYAPTYWGLGMNKGQVEYYRDLMIERLQKENTAEPVTLVGWSLGGVVAREVARVLPEKINSVFIFGSPIKGPKYTVGAKVYGESETQRITHLLEELDDNQPVQVPLSIVFSKNDTVVSWPSCLDLSSPKVKHYEVKSTHISMVIDPDIWQLLALHLEQHLVEQ